VIEGLGNTFNVVPTADGVEVNLRNAGAVTFICVGADTYTVQESTDASGSGAQDLDVVDHYYASSSAAGAAAWTRATQAADAAVTIGAGICAIEVNAAQLSDGFDFVECTSTAAGLVIAILHRLAVARKVTNLPAVAV
jgi:hypothetical protein